MTDQQFETLLYMFFGLGIGWDKWSDWRHARQWKAYDDWVNNGRKGPMP